MNIKLAIDFKLIKRRAIRILKIVYKNVLNIFKIVFDLSSQLIHTCILFIFNKYNRFKENITHRHELKKENLKFTGIVFLILGLFLALAYGIAYTISLSNHTREIIGYVFQVTTGFIFAVEQISRREEIIIKFQKK